MVSRRQFVLGAAVAVCGLILPPASNFASLEVRGRELGVIPDTNQSMTSALRNALEILAAAGGRLLLEPGTYLVGPLTLPAGTSLIAMGRVVLAAERATSSWLKVGAGHYPAILQGLQLDSRDRALDHVLRVPSGAGLVMKACKIRANGKCHGVSVVPGARVVDITSTAIDGTHTAIYIRGSISAVSLAAVHVTRWRQRGIAFIADENGGASNVRLTNCRVDPPTPGGTVRQPISFTANNIGRFRNVTITYCKVTGTAASYLAPGNAGVADLISLHRCELFSISNNVCAFGGDMGITVAQGCRRGIILDNLCRDNDSCGVAVGSAASAERTTDVLISGNTMTGNGRDRIGKRSTAARAQLWLYNVSDVSIEQNLFDRTGSRIVNGAAAPPISRRHARDVYVAAGQKGL